MKLDRKATLSNLSLVHLSPDNIITIEYNELEQVTIKEENVLEPEEVMIPIDEELDVNDVTNSDQDAVSPKHEVDEVWTEEIDVSIVRAMVINITECF